MPSPIEAMTMSEAVLSPNEIIDASSPLYLSETRCWSEQKYLKPAVVLRPKSVPALQRVVQALYDSQLDFAVRCNGVGSSSAEDVVLSMRAFNGFEFDPVAETITIGAGQTFGDVERKMEELAPGYAMLSARVPWVGVSGMTLTSGISWLSHEFGLAYDPQNLLDAQVVLRDGRVLWASAAPDLLWALRGGGGNFGVVTAFKLRVRRYPSNIFVGMIMYPNPAVEIVSKAVSDFVTRNKDPKIGMNVFVLTSQSKFFAAPTDSIGLMLYDANGLEHGRSEQGFKWALDIPGALDMTASMTLAQYNKLQAHTHTSMSTLTMTHACALVPTIDAHFLTRAWNWFEHLKATSPALAAGSFLIVELLQEAALTSAAPHATAWPHPTTQHHVLQFGVGYPTGMDCTEELALEMLQRGLQEVPLAPVKQGAFMPNFVERFMDVKKIYGANYGKLRLIKTKYDPRGRFNKGVFIPPYKESSFRLLGGISAKL